MTNETMAAVLGRNLKRLMKSYQQEHGQKISHEGFAGLFKIPPRLFAYYLAGKRFPSWDKLEIMAKVLNTTSDDLLFE